MKILHFSDSHAGGEADEWTAYLDKRWVGIFNYCFRRKFQHDQRFLEKAVNYIMSSDADIAVCTGDVTSTGQPSEFEKAMKLLSPLAKSKKLIYVPGNHDFYVYSNNCVSALFNSFRFLNSDRFSLSDLPLSIRIADCDFILVNESRPTNLISSCGYMKKRDSEKITRLLEEKTDHPVILVGHYPLIEKKPLLRIRHRLWGQIDVLNLLKTGKIDLSLCGHVHKPYFIETGKKGRGELCAGSVTKTSCISEITYKKNEDSFEIKQIDIAKN
jgi:3',5'-cyclic AMP phosphodiesterase CpdA